MKQDSTIYPPYIISADSLAKVSASPQWEAPYFEELPPIVKTVVGGNFYENGEVITNGDLTPQTRPDFSSGWETGAILFGVVLIAWVNVYYRKRLGQLLNALVSNRFVNQLVREEQAFSNRGSLTLNVIFLLMAGLFITLSAGSSSILSGGSNSLLLFLQVLSLLLMWFGSKLLLIKFSGTLFSVEGLMGEYLFHFLLSTNFLGLALVPVVIGMAYFPFLATSTFIVIGVSLSGIILASRLTKMLFLGFGTNGVSSLYIILYLCTLEILPLVYLIKLVQFQTP